MKQFKFIWNLFKGDRLKYLIAILSMIVYVLLQLTTPLYIAFLIDNVINQEPLTSGLIYNITSLFGGASYIRENLWVGAVIIIVINATIGIFVYTRGNMVARGCERPIQRLRDQLYDHLQRMPYSYHVKSKTGDLIQRCTSDVDTIRRFFAGQFTEIFWSLLTVGMAIYILMSKNVMFALISIASMPLLFIISAIYFKNMQKVFTRADEIEGELSTIVQENLTGIRVVKAFNREKYEIEKFEGKNEEFRKSIYDLVKLLAYYWGGTDLICLVQILIVVVTGIVFAGNGDISLGTFTVFVSYETMILWPVRSLGRMLADAGKMSVSIGRIQEILDEPVEDIDTGLTPEISGAIEFSHVDFKYDDGNVNVLNDINFTIEAGQTVAILGPTGSGKSSLVHLLTRLYDYTAGSIKIDGIELKSIARGWVRKHVGIVLQEPFLFSKTIYDNIHISNKDASEDDVYRAARIASVHGVISEFEKAYETPVGENGVTLSGGQKQRVAIARTVIGNTPVLIFDDSLSAVDTETDAAIRKALQDVSKNTTMIIITHRVSSAMQADKIITFEKGSISQVGDHDSLINEEGLYKRIYEIQSNLITKEVE